MKLILKTFPVILLLLFVVSAVYAQSEGPKVRIETNKGIFVIELDATAAPKTTENFLSYVNSGFYTNTIFHRVIKGFMIQGGGFDTNMRKKETLPPITNEADNGLKNLKGTIAMARTSAPHSASSQFFINTVDNHFLNFKKKNRSGWGYCVFGRVIQGMDVVTTIENTPTAVRSGYRDVPVDAVIIKSATVVEEKPTAEKPAK